MTSAIGAAHMECAACVDRRSLSRFRVPQVGIPSEPHALLAHFPPVRHRAERRRVKTVIQELIYKRLKEHRHELFSATRKSMIRGTG
jgi:hypothetical protein